jgi:hypothetical protein
MLGLRYFGGAYFGDDYFGGDHLLGALIVDEAGADRATGTGTLTFAGVLAVSETGSDTASIRVNTYRRTDDLLPQNAPLLLQTFAAAGGRVQDIPTPIETVRQPFAVTAAFLPFLGWEMSVDVWFRDWPEATKRAITARSLQLHQKKGTAYCIREYVRYAGGVVRQILRPPMVVYSGPSLTREQREAWLSALPQLRVWLVQEEGRFGTAKAFHGGYQRGLFVERSYAVPSTALSRLHRRARWLVDGVESDVRVSDFGSYYRLHFKSVEGKKVFDHRPIGGHFYIPSDAWRRLVTIMPQARLPWRSPSGPTLQPVTNEPERVTVAGTRGRSVFDNVPMHGYFVPSTAKYRIFDRFAVHDGRRVLRRPACQFMGTGRYGFPRHTAHVDASIPGRRSRWQAGDGLLIPRARFWLPHDGSRVDNVRRAIQAAKRLSDHVLLKTGPTHRFVAGKPFFADVDRFTVGQP